MNVCVEIPNESEKKVNGKGKNANYQHYDNVQKVFISTKFALLLQISYYDFLHFSRLHFLSAVNRKDGE